jgi:hypothetical protein
MDKRVLSIIIFQLLFLNGICQDTVKNTVPAKIIMGDTVAMLDAGAVVIFPPARFENKRQAARYDKLVYNVKKVYPYAKLAGQKLAFYRNVMDTIEGEKPRKVYMKKAEKELQDQFGDEIRDLTFSQGKILIKLIYRETGNSSFDLVKDLRGGFTAFIWQTMARIFGYDLKTRYDPAGDDQAIEQIILMIEAGAI